MVISEKTNRSFWFGKISGPMISSQKQMLSWLTREASLRRTRIMIWKWQNNFLTTPFVQYHVMRDIAPTKILVIIA